MENIKYQTKLPWVSNVVPILFIIIGIPGIVLINFRAEFIKFISIVLICILIKGILKLLHNLTTKVYLTDKKITISTGLINKDIVDISIDKSEAIWVSQGVLGKIFNYGSISINTAGMSISQLISNPMEFRNLLNKN